jgi:D-3-phosphoglycerate dehydrogenase
LRGKSIGIHAFGYVGKNVARIAKGFEMEIYAFDPFLKDEEKMAAGITFCNSAEELYAKCQYVSLHIPANEKTKKSIGYDTLKTMPHGAVLVNTARKEVIDEEGLMRLMEERQDFVYLSDIEPDAKAAFEEKLKGRFLFTAKKMGAQTQEANINAGVAAAKQIADFFATGNQTFRVNK